MADDRYECWATHREDLTERVLACAESRGGVVIGARPVEADALKQNTCIVLCSEGHENVFVLEPKA